MKSKKIFYVLTLLCFLRCSKDKTVGELITYDSTPYTLEYGNFPTPELPLDNKLTIEGIKLGRMLFYEKMLSKGNKLACAGCHAQKDGFSDLNTFSKGVDGLEGTRQAMPIINMAWHNNGFFWDGRAPKLRDQALKPIQDHLEMNETLDNVILKLSSTNLYKDQFTRSFVDGAINSVNISFALEQFMFTLVSNDAKYDRFLNGKTTLTDSEERGRNLFFKEFDPTGKTKGAECFHCHGGFNFSNDDYMNNGLDEDISFTDTGREKVSFLPEDRAKFKTPSLRNIAVTGPYMHDGRFSSLDDVLKHYNVGVNNSSTLDVLMQYNIQPGGLGLTKQDRDDVIAFLHTLTDDSFLTNPAFKDPN
ncbi:MAG: cytochrome-c peroxidase [Saprospiraceae bacterium]|nr:cytochrome-c peroxidase [Saprospiraceae bacterium]